MIVHDQKVASAAARTSRSAGIRYAVRRWAELLDPKTHFCHAASSYLDPLTAIREFVVVARGYLNGDGTRYDAVMEIILNTRDTLAAERNAAAWFPQERGQAIAALTQALGINSKATLKKKKQYVKWQAGSLLGNEIKSFSQVLEDPATGYRSRLIEKVCEWFETPPTNEQEWAEDDLDLTFLAAVADAEGRDGERLALAFADAVNTSRTDQAVATAFAALLNEPRRDYTVALVLRGAGQIQNAQSFGCTPLHRPYRWNGASNSSANRRLRDFVRQESRTRLAAPFAMKVQAWDPQEARVLARTAAEPLLDQVAAEHRLNDFQLAERVAVWDVASDGVDIERGRSGNGVKSARTLAPRGVAALERSLRYHTLARNENVPVLAVLHSWIALEYLAIDGQTLKQDGTWKPQGPGAFLPPHVGSVMALAAAKNQLTSVWLLLRDLGRRPRSRARWAQVERWLGVQANNKLVDLSKWTTLLTETVDGVAAPVALDENAPASDAASFLLKLAAELEPFAEQRLLATRWRLADGSRLNNWCAGQADRAHITTARVKRIRHKTVHTALARDESSRQIAQAARDILDAVYEVLPAWLAPGTPTWRSLHDARAWQLQLVGTWNQAAGPPAIDPSRIIRP